MMHFVGCILTPSLENPSDYEGPCAFAQQDIMRSYSANNSLPCLESVFGNRIISRALCDFYLRVQ